MSIQQRSYFCPRCQQQRLFTRQGMNHTPHLLASVFLCGLWLPIWALIAASYNAMFHCSQCGHSDATEYLANPNLRHQRAQHAALRAKQETSFVDAFRHWFRNLSNRGKAVAIAAPILLFMWGILAPIIDKSNRPSNTQTNTSTALSVPSNKTIAPATPLTPSPSNLSSTENLALGKKALGDGDLSTARNHLSAIPKEAKEFASAKQYLATLERREKRKTVEDELESVKRDEAGVEDTMNRTEHMLDSEGTIGKQIYANALKRKGELQLRRIKLERKLKGMP
ncbi:MAG: hypothetical protein JWO69_1903 [Thermoleophilia bacterium]|nr:hypothetical protein [Thermoleophilia bacterium]